MDGGRILRALLWRVRGDRFGATRLAAAVGRLFGFALIGLGVVLVLQGGGIFGGLWLALIGWFLSNAAEATVAQMSVQRSLRGIRVRQVMDATPPAISPNLSVAELVNDHLMRGHDRSFLVTHDDGVLAGLVTLTDVKRTPREEWDTTRVTDIMTRYGDLVSVRPDDEVERALDLLQQREINQLPVLDDGRRALGLITRGGLLRLIDTRLKLGV
jgi:CBS domain-containing protein